MNDFNSLLLEPFELGSSRIHFQTCAGGGKDGYVFKVRIRKKDYALKMFKFDHPGLNVTKLKGTQRNAFYDPFYIECRANGALIQHALIQQGLNGQILPFCYGQIDVPTAAEIQVAKRFNIQPFLWNRPENLCDQKVRGMLFDWVDAKSLTQTTISSNVADQARKLVKALHSAGIAHNDLAASNFLAQDQTLYLIDLSSSVTLPHIKVSAQELERRQRKDIQSLEVGLALLSKILINQGRCFADLSATGKASLDDIFADSEFIQHLWAPPQPTCWQPTALSTQSMA
ncbi:hypothetical protein CLAIMM_14180 [Cladophialophora immunda]|nr:hypothetical protein CLAIMM_14180 [Cladophialophora immunda]